MRTAFAHVLFRLRTKPATRRERRGGPLRRDTEGHSCRQNASSVCAVDRRPRGQSRPERVWGPRRGTRKAACSSICCADASLSSWQRAERLPIELQEMPATVTDHHSNGSLSIPRTSSDGGTPNGTLTPTAGQSLPTRSWSPSESTIVQDGDRDAQVRRSCAHTACGAY